MENAIWLVTNYIPWFWGLFLWPPGWETLSLVTYVTTGLFVIGAVLAWRHWNPRVLWILLSPAIGFVLMAVAGLLRGEVENPTPYLTALYAVQILVLAGVIWLAKGSRFATFLMTPVFAWFWIYGTFMASMAFRDSWL